MSKYAGFCVGGPLRGQKIASQDKVIRIMGRKGITQPGPGGINVVLPTTETVYYWQSTPLPSPEHHGYWRHSSLTLERATEQLIESYAREHAPTRL